MMKKIFFGSFVIFILSGTVFFFFCKKSLKNICDCIKDDKEFSIHFETKGGNLIC